MFWMLIAQASSGADPFVEYWAKWNQFLFENRDAAIAISVTVTVLVTLAWVGSINAIRSGQARLVLYVLCAIFSLITLAHIILFFRPSFSWPGLLAFALSATLAFVFRETVARWLGPIVILGLVGVAFRLLTWGMNAEAMWRFITR
jgi:hypothetical protein